MTDDYEQVFGRPRREFRKDKTYASWAFTLNNYTKDDEQLFQDLDLNLIVYGREIGKNGTPHLQGFLRFKKGKRFAGMTKLNPRCHWEPAFDDEAAFNYCLKDQDYYLKDNRQQGKRTDIDAIVNAVKIEKKNPTQIAAEFPWEYIKFSTGIEKLYAKLQGPRTTKPNVIWLYGPTGCGKTRFVYDNHALEDIWVSMKNLKNWEGYTQQPVVLIDDFRKDFCTFHELLRILDRYPYTVNIKYSSAQLNSEYIYITCPYKPDEIYETREDIKQLLRRIDEVIEVKADSDSVSEVAKGNTKLSPQPIETIEEFEETLDRVLTLEI